MDIGKKVGTQGDDALRITHILSNGESGKTVSVEAIQSELKLDRVQIRNVFDYLQTIGLIRIESIGGEFLYGHISLTRQGVMKAATLF
ncbi:MAG: hypothetical protein ACNA78_00465 [Balneolaceae bacterium]